jgi:hypothetical protein
VRQVHSLSGWRSWREPPLPGNPTVVLDQDRGSRGAYLSL